LRTSARQVYGLTTTLKKEGRKQAYSQQEKGTLVPHRDPPHTEWTEDQLLRDIAELEAALAKYASRHDAETEWARTLVIKALESRRKLLAALRSKRR
jgi:hypothetical protein